MSEDRYKHYHTHDLTKNHEINWCLKCGHNLVSLGVWGDEHWQKGHNLWQFTCEEIIEMGANKEVWPDVQTT